MAKLKKTLPKNFRDLIVAQDWDTLKAELKKCEPNAYERGGTEHILFARALDKQIETTEDIYRHPLYGYFYTGREPDCYDYLSTDMIEWLVKDRGCDVNFAVRLKLKNTTHTNDFHPLDSYIQWKKVDIVEKLLELGANPNTICYGRFTPLNWACTANQHDIIKLLLKHGANPAFCRYDSPLEQLSYHAIKNKKLELNADLIDSFNLLFEHGAGQLKQRCYIRNLYQAIQENKNSLDLKDIQIKDFEKFNENLNSLMQ